MAGSKTVRPLIHKRSQLPSTYQGQANELLAELSRLS